MRNRTDEVREHNFTGHVLVYTNGRESEHADCAEADGPTVYSAVTSWLCGRNVFWSRVHVIKTSCLGLCNTDGTAATIHPRNRWYSNVRPDDVPTLLAEVFGPDASNLGVRPRD